MVNPCSVPSIIRPFGCGPFFSSAGATVQTTRARHLPDQSIGPTDRGRGVRKTARLEAFLGSRVGQRGDIIESFSTLHPFSAPLTPHLVNILCHAPFGVTDAAVTGAAFIWHCFG